jgi:nitrite reductase/ring-hydroxylating ferredoxin subunit
MPIGPVRAATLTVTTDREAPKGAAMKFVRDVIGRLERMESLDRVAKPLATAVGRAVRPRVLRNLLSGTYLGHPVHPALTDVPIGAWTMSALLDNVGGRNAERSADLLVAAGVLGAIPTAASGLNDWSDTYGPDTRIGLVHATANVTALSLYAASLAARARGNRVGGKRLAQAGLGALLTGAYLGGHLTFTRGINVNRNAWTSGPPQWTPVLADAELPEAGHRTVHVDGVEIALFREDGRVWAINKTCSHMGGPLDEGDVVDGCVICPWHGSTFRLDGGGVVRGPASAPQPRYDTRVLDDRIEIRAVE